MNIKITEGRTYLKSLDARIKCLEKELKKLKKEKAKTGKKLKAEYTEDDVKDLVQEIFDRDESKGKDCIIIKRIWINEGINYCYTESGKKRENYIIIQDYLRELGLFYQPVEWSVIGSEDALFFSTINRYSDDSRKILRKSDTKPGDPYKYFLIDLLTKEGTIISIKVGEGKTISGTRTIHQF